MKTEHPLIDRAVRWLTFLSLVAGAVGMWWYVVDERNRSIEHTAYLREVRADQGAIRNELAAQTESLHAIRAEQGRIVAGQRALTSDFNRALVQLAFDMGAHAQQHAEP